MPAGLLDNDKIMYADRQLPWHGIGNPLGETDLRNIGKVREAAGLTWAVREMTPFIETPDGNIPLNTVDVDEVGNVKNDGFRVLVRDDDYTPLSVVKGRYVVQQNDVLFDIAAAMADEGDVIFETAGSLRGGRTVWTLARLGDDPRLDGLDLQRYLMVAKSHDGTSPIMVVPTMTRVVCCNTFAVASTDPALTRIKHTRRADQRIEDAKQALREMYNSHDSESEAIYRMVNTEITNAQFDDIVNACFNPNEYTEGKGFTQATNRINTVRAIYDLDDNADIRGTGWGVVNAVNDAEIWFSSIRGDWTQEEQQMQRIVDGKQPLTQQAQKLVLA